MVTAATKALEARLCDFASSALHLNAAAEMDPIVEYGCTGSTSTDISADGASTAASFNIFVCANGNCFTLPVEVRRTGSYADANGGQGTGGNATTLATIPRVCQGSICVIRDPKPVQAPDLNNYYVDYFGNQDEVKIYHPFSTTPITLDIEQICATTNDTFHDCP